MVPRPCLRSLDKPIVALWGLEPLDLFAILGVVGGLMACLGLKALKAGKPRGYVFYLFYRSGILRICPEALRPPYLVIPPAPGRRRLSFSAAPGPEDDETPEARYFKGNRNYVS